MSAVVDTTPATTTGEQVTDAMRAERLEAYDFLFVMDKLAEEEECVRFEVMLSLSQEMEEGDHEAVMSAAMAEEATRLLSKRTWSMMDLSPFQTPAWDEEDQRLIDTPIVTKRRRYYKTRASNHK